MNTLRGTQVGSVNFSMLSFLNDVVSNFDYNSIRELYDIVFNVATKLNKPTTEYNVMIFCGYFQANKGSEYYPVVLTLDGNYRFIQNKEMSELNQILSSKTLMHNENEYLSRQNKNNTKINRKYSGLMPFRSYSGDLLNLQGFGSAISSYSSYWNPWGNKLNTPNTPVKGNVSVSQGTPQNLPGPPGSQTAGKKNKMKKQTKKPIKTKGTKKDSKKSKPKSKK